MSMYRKIEQAREPIRSNIEVPLYQAYRAVCALQASCEPSTQAWIKSREIRERIVSAIESCQANSRPR